MNEEEEDRTTIKVDLAILIAAAILMAAAILTEAVILTEMATGREVRILMVEESATVVEAEMLTAAVAAVAILSSSVVAVTILMAAVVAVAILMAAVVEVMVITVPPRTTKIIRAIFKWCLCLGHLETALVLDAAYPSVSPRKDRGLVYEN